MNALKRTLQYAGLSALGVGAKMTGKGLLNKALKRKMADKMAGMKGIPLKVCQILGMNESEGAELHQLAQEKIDPIPEDDVRNIIKNSAPQLYEQGDLLEDYHCASLGQVNHFKVNDKEYAVKIQYPESEQNLEMDEKALGLVTKTFSGFSKGFNMSDYQQTLRAELQQELDYNREMEMQHEFYRVFAEDKDIIIPLSYKKFSSKNCLFMTWEPSLNLHDFLKVASAQLKKDATKLITHFYLQSIFKHGLLHADPNPGNFGFRLEHGRVSLVVYDFGSVVKLERRKHMDLLALFSMTIEGQNPFGALLALGFNVDFLEPLKDKLSALMMVLFEPFIFDQKFNLEKWKRKERVRDILGEDRWNFMVAAPADLFLFMRSVSGLFFYTGKLSGGIYCRPVIERVLKYYKEDVEKAAISFLEDVPSDKKELSEKMIISVVENGRQKVKLSLPARSIENLSAIIPPNICTALEEKGIDTELLLKKVRENAYRAQQVFELIDGQKKITVSLV